MTKQAVLKLINKGLIVSCQARVGWPMYGNDIMAALAKAAMVGGACGIRATGADNIKAIKQLVNLPIIGINKCFSDECEVYITPTYKSAEEVLECGIEIIALDATSRARPNHEKIEDIVKKIKENYPEVLIMGEISTLDEAKNILDLGFDLISTTLSGYTEQTKEIMSVNLELIRQIKEICDVPIVAEGKIKTEEEALEALKAGAYSVVVGTSITRPEVITRRYVDKIGEFNNS